MTARWISALFIFWISASPAYALRIVSLMPSNTEIVESLGLGNEVVGVTRFDRPVAGRTVVGDFVQPSVETIVALKPDIVLAGVWQSSRLVPRLKAAGLQVVEIRNPRSIAEIYDSILLIGDVLHRHDEAQRVVAEIKAHIERIQAQTHGLRPLRVYFEVDDPLWTIGGPTFITEMIRIAGGENIFSDLTQDSAHISAEALIQKNPEVIVSLIAKRDRLLKRPGWDAIRAVRDQAIIDDVHEDWMSRPSPNVVKGIEELATKFQAIRQHHP